MPELRGNWFVTAFLASVLAYAQQASVPELAKQASEAHQKQDYAAFLSLEQQILKLVPDDPTATYNVACGQALAGHAAESIKALEQLLVRRLDLGAEKDADFDKIRSSPEWKSYADHLAEMRKPLVRSTPAFTLAEKGLLATGIAVDEKRGDVYVASARERKIVKRSKDGSIADFATAKDGLMAVSTLLLDPAREQLIATTAGVSFMLDSKKENLGRSGILFFDLVTRKVVRSVFFPSDGARHVLDAMAEDESGNVFVVDTGTSAIYRIRRASEELELFISSVVFRAAHGIALSADGRTLYVMDLIDGMSAVEVLSNDRVHLDAPPDVFMRGMVGLTRVGDCFVAVQLGVPPNRVVRIRLDTGGKRITSVETLESNHPDYASPFQGVASGGKFFYVANSQLGQLDPKTGLFPMEKAKPTVVLQLPIGQ